MAKVNVTGWVSEDARAGIEGAGAAMGFDNGAIVRTLETCGVNLKGEVERLREEHGDQIPKCRLELRLVPEE